MLANTRSEGTAQSSGQEQDEGGPTVIGNGDWSGYIKSAYLEPLVSGDRSNELAYSRYRLGGCWRCIYRIAKLPWTAILLVAISVALICVFIVFIVNGPSSRSGSSTVIVVNGTQVFAPSSNLVTIQCETDVSKEECEKRARDRVSAMDFQQAMTETHLFTTLIMFWLAATIFFVIKAVRVRKRNRHLESLPRSSMPVFADLIPQQAASPSSQPPPQNGPGGMNGQPATLLSSHGSSMAAPITSNLNLNTMLLSPTHPAVGPSGGGGSNVFSGAIAPSSTASTNLTLSTSAPSTGVPTVHHQGLPGYSSNQGAAAINTTSTTLAPAPGSTASAAVMRDDVTSYMASKVPVHQEMQRTAALRRCLKYYVETNTLRSPSDTNWGWRGEWTGVHFPSTIRLASYEYLETRAVEFDPALRIRKDQTVREWLMMLKTRFTDEELAHKSLDLLADSYEIARFSNEAVDESAWYSRMTHAYQISKSFEEMLGKKRGVVEGATSASFKPSSKPDVGQEKSSSPETPLRPFEPLSPLNLGLLASPPQREAPPTLLSESYVTAYQEEQHTSATRPKSNSTSSSLHSSSTNSEAAAVSPFAPLPELPIPLGALEKQDSETTASSTDRLSVSAAGMLLAGGRYDLAVQRNDSFLTARSRAGSL